MSEYIPVTATARSALRVYQTPGRPEKKGERVYYPQAFPIALIVAQPCLRNSNIRARIVAIVSGRARARILHGAQTPSPGYQSFVLSNTNLLQ